MKRIVVGAKHDKVDFYKHLGFNVCGDEFKICNIPHIYMEKVL